MIDTHAHIYLDQFNEDLDQVVDRALANGIEKIFMPNIDSSTIEALLAAEERFGEVCFPMMGLHPCSVKEDYREELRVVKEWLDKRSFLAVGEIGTDLYWDKTYWEEQIDAFEIQCELAILHNLPVVIHCRESIDETIELVRKYAERGLRGVFHCFTGSASQAKQITDLGFYLGLGGVCTFKNGGMDKVVPFMDRSKIILETDSPYLTPTPHRGKRNEPSYISLVLVKVSEFLGMESSELDKLSTDNANDLFSANNNS
ncbi:MAG: TatD family hydrolase [Ekhidna sp.]|nr:TatD family hydrolase [Ekhidna sp.]